MNSKHYPLQNGFATILTLIGMLLVAVSLPVATKLVQQTQENRSSARMVIDDDIQTPTKPTSNTPIPINPAGHEPRCDKGDTKCDGGYTYTCNTSYRWVKTTKTCSDPQVTQGVPLCTSVNYGSWSECLNGKQTRTVTKTPSGCSGGVPVESNTKDCTITLTCTSFTTGSWGACNQFADGYFQTRTVTGYPTGCTGGTPPSTRQTCNNNDGTNGGHEPQCDKGDTKCIDGFINTCNTSYGWVKTTKTCSDPKVTPGIPLCTKITYGTWSECLNGKQTRTVTKTPSNCSGGVYVEPSIKDCTITPICTSFTPGPWGACNKYADGYFQTRTVTGNPEGCTGGTPPSTRQVCCTSSNCSVCTSASLCSFAGCYWETQLRTCTTKPKTCTSSNCGGCVSPNECRLAGCSWESEVKACTSKSKENLPIALCDGAIIGIQKCSSGAASAVCTETGWEINNCNILKGEECIENKCQNAKDYKKNFTSCTATTFLGIYTTYESDACPEGYSCDRTYGICKPIEKLAAKKAAGSTCETDADCQSGFCRKVSGDSIMASLGASYAKYCEESTDVETITEEVKIGGIGLAVIAAITTGGVGIPALIEAGVPTTTALAAMNWVVNNPKAASIIQGGFYSLNLLSSLDCLVNPHREGCEEQAMLSAAIPGTGIVDDIGDFYNWAANQYNALKAANALKASANLAVDVSEAVVDITDGLVDTRKTIDVISVVDPESNSPATLFDFKPNKSYISPSSTEETVRVYRGIRKYDGVNPYDQVGNMARFYKPDVFLDSRSPRITSQEILPAVIELAHNPTPENYLKYFELSNELGLNQYPYKVDEIGSWAKSDNFVDNLIRQHAVTTRNAIGTSPYVATTTDLSIANGFGDTIIVADIPITDLVFSELADEGEVLVKGYINPSYIRGTIENIDDTVSVFSSINPIDRVNVLVTELLQ